MALPDTGAAPGDNTSAGPEEFKTCYYCGKKMSTDAPRCETCGNNRSFTWSNHPAAAGLPFNGRIAYGEPLHGGE